MSWPSGGKTDVVPVVMIALAMEAMRPEQDADLCAAPRRPLHSLSSRTVKALLRAVMVSLVTVAAGPVGIAMAEAPSVMITSPPNESVTNNPTPTFHGLAEEGLGGEVTLAIYSGQTATGLTVQMPIKTPLSLLAGSWELTAEHLPDGIYTAQATQTTLALETGTSRPVTFTVDTTPPQVTITSPANGSSTTSGSQEVSGAAGTAIGDSSTVTIQLFSGATTELQAPLEALTVPVSNGSWSATFGGLSPGTYTVRAEQSDEVGNLGMSAPVTFTVSTPAAPPAVPPPAASFKWFPAAPKTGENVSLVSSSTDAASPITAFAWALTGNGAFQAGKPVFTTSFSTPGSHVVQLRVTDGNGLSSVATQAVYVSSSPLILMQPFPIVRIAGSETSSGVRLSLLTAQAPAGARVTVSCRGRGCPTKSASRVAVSSKRNAGAVVVEFRRFERSLAAGVILDVRISKAGEIGKFTRFVVRHGKLPQRVDMCLQASGVNPLVCPSS
jgi:Bacterial Ig-like domain/PKD domain